MDRRGISVNGATIMDAVQMAKEAESAGFDVVWYNDNTGVDGLIGMAAMALNTSRIQLGSGVARAFVRAPTVTAVAAADLDEISHGRFILGFAGGTPRQNLVESSVWVEHPVPQMRELITILRDAWSHETPSDLVFDGKYYHLNARQFRRHKAYKKQIPIYMAAVREVMLQLTGELCDGLAGHPVNSIWFIQNYIEPNLAIGLKRAGRTRDSFDLSSWVLCSISSDRKQARREAAGTIANYLSTRSYSHICDLQGWSAQRAAIQDAFHVNKDLNAMVDAVTDDMIDAMSITGTKDEVRKRFEAYEGVVQLPTFQAPGWGTTPDRRMEAQRLIMEVFGK